MPGERKSSPACDPLPQNVEELLGRFVAANPQYSLDPVQPTCRGSTNHLMFGRCARRRVVFKCFWSPDRWRNELYFLRLLGPTGLVPKVMATTDQKLIVMHRLPGTYVSDCTRTLADRPEAIDRLSREVGQALGRITQVPLTEDPQGYHPARCFVAIPWGQDLRAVVMEYVRRCRRVQQVVPHYALPLADQSLSLVESSAARVGAEPQIVFHEDVGNMHAVRGHFRGFFDLEMARNGTESMQIGVALCYCGRGRLNRQPLFSGYQSQVGRHPDALSALAMNHLYHWIRACRWGRIGGDNDDPADVQASVRDAKVHLGGMAQACRLLWDEPSVRPWFAQEAVAQALSASPEHH